MFLYDPTPSFPNPGRSQDRRSPTNLRVPRLPSSVPRRAPQYSRRLGRGCRKVPQFASDRILELHVFELWRASLLRFDACQRKEADRAAPDNRNRRCFTLRFISPASLIPHSAPVRGCCDLFSFPNFVIGSEHHIPHPIMHNIQLT